MSLSPEPTVEQAARGRRNWRRSVLTIAQATLALAAIVPPLAYYGARRSWVCDALTHFQAPAAVLALFVGVLCLARRRWWVATAFLLLATWQVPGFLRFSGPIPVVAAGGESTRIRILMANVLHPSQRYADLTHLIRREHPDIVGLVEISSDWIAGLEQTGIRAEFPYRVEIPLGGQGLALWFREPPHRMEPVQVFSFPGNPVLKATFQLGENLTTVWLVHPPNPIGEGRERSNPDLIALGEQIGLRGGSQIVVGDLNRTEFSPFFADFLAETRLRDSRLGIGRQPSWPTWSPYRITLDHAFLSPDLAVIDRRLGPDIGSDHLPLIIDIGLASDSMKSTK